MSFDYLFVCNMQHCLICVSVLIFRGAVAVTMDLLKLDISQCPDKYYVPNVFKGTDKCDQKTSYVSIVALCN